MQPRSSPTGKRPRRDKRLTAKAAELEKRLKDGTTLDTIAAELKLEKQTKRGVKREADDADFGKDGVAAMFGVAEGGTGTVPSPTRRRAHPVQGRPKCSNRPAPTPDSVPEDAQKSFASGLSDDLLDQLVAQPADASTA